MKQTCKNNSNTHPYDLMHVSSFRFDILVPISVHQHYDAVSLASCRTLFVRCVLPVHGLYILGNHISTLAVPCSAQCGTRLAKKDYRDHYRAMGAPGAGVQMLEQDDFCTSCSPQCARLSLLPQRIQ